MKKRELIIFILFMINLLFCSSFNLISEAEERSKAPDFNLEDFNGKSKSLSEFKGKVVLLNFWATWCPPCRAELPELSEIYTRYKDRGVAIIGINLDEERDKDVKKFLSDRKIILPVLHGNNKVVEAYGNFFGIPTSFLIDKNGYMSKSFPGYQPKETFEAEIKKIIEE